MAKLIEIAAANIGCMMSTSSYIVQSHDDELTIISSYGPMRVKTIEYFGLADDWIGGKVCYEDWLRARVEYLKEKANG